MKAFVDDYRLIRLELKEPISFISFPEIEGKLIYINEKPHYQLEKDLTLNKDYYIYINDYKIFLEIGLVTKTDKFASENYTKETQGIIYSKEKTIFNLYAPISKDVILVLEDEEIKMKGKNGFFTTTIKKDLLNKKYYYLVKNGTYYTKTLDPYATLGTDNYSLVSEIGLNYENDKIRKLAKPENDNPIICEAHIKDLTANLNIPNKGLYLGLLENAKELDNKNVLDYIKDLGYNYIQFQPVLDFLGVDDIKKDNLYNWGYNPHQFFILDGWYSKDPDDARLRHEEFSKVVDYAHKIGLGVILDVVYNHVYTKETFPASRIIPNYYQMFDDKGRQTDFCGCGNDFDILKKQAFKIVKDSVEFITKTYKIDGYRFDLMGLMDVTTMNNIKDNLTKINPNILLYGEGWNMNTLIPNEQRANQLNSWKLPDYGFFNDHFREYYKALNAIRLSNFNEKHIGRLDNFLNGSPDLFLKTTQTINYIECHDDMTYYDHLVYNLKVDPKEAREYQILAMYYIALAKGISFYQIGMENFRTKNGLHNTYNNNTGVNYIKYDINSSSVKEFKEILNLKKKHFKNDRISKSELKNGVMTITTEQKNGNIISIIKNGKINYSLKQNQEIIYSKQSNKDIVDILTIYEKNTK